MSSRHKAPIYKMDPNKNRILQALLYLISEADKRGLEATQYFLVKALFLADKSHLNSFGRPITFDNYVAMNHGPVPSYAYRLLREEVDFRKEFGLRGRPWKKKKAKINKNANAYSQPTSTIALDDLSPSDLEALSNALMVASSLSFSQLRKLTHEDPAYVDAWDDESGKRAYPISYGLLFDVPDYEQAEIIAHASKHS